MIYKQTKKCYNYKGGLVMDVNKELKKYIEENIMVQYDNNNYGGHGWNHIVSVIDRSFELAKKFNLNLNSDMIYIQ